MNRSARALAAILVFVVGLVAIAAVIVYVASTSATSTSATTQPATTAPATQSVAPPPPAPPRTYGEIVKSAYPQLATTQPMGVPLDVYTEAAHFVLDTPVYVCSRGDLWLTRKDAPASEDVLAAAVDEQTHLLAERVVFVHWSLNDRGRWQPRVVARREDGAFELVSPERRIAIPTSRHYLWHRAMSWGDAIVVPTESGVSVLKPGDSIAEVHGALPLSDSSSDLPLAEPQIAFDFKGFIAWIPWDDGTRGSIGAIRFADGGFAPLGSEQGWPQKLVQVVPLLDGSVLQVVRDGSGAIAPRLEVLNHAPVDEKAVTALVDQLTDADPERRQQAYNELTRYGPLVWPLLEKLVKDQPPEARIRLQQLLENKIQPTMGGLTLVDGAVQTAARLPDGGVVFFAAEGVSFAREDAEPVVVKPAWISIRPGKPVELLPHHALSNAQYPQQRIDAFGSEWILIDEQSGPQHLLYNHTRPLLRKDEKRFSRLYAIDRRGRWLFREPEQTSAAPTRTLIIDPTFPDPTPHLPIWLLEIRNGSTGWDERDWPVIKSGGAWALRERGWQPLDETKQKMLTERPADDRSVGDASGEPLLVDADGNRYYDGATLLHVVSKDNRHTVWPLPLAARGLPGATLIRAADGRLFLFNQPGRVCRIQPTPDGDEPFKLEATFTERVPAGNIARIWLDPANRICIVYGGNKLAILFPQGHIPPHIATMIPANELR